ncbi:MAG: ATP-binding cassette domain-containing protein [Methanomicrobiaceae archaeon]|nr:ATP-binding cassette domain-containing protein [Methanomicrobiaceae archaeon]
MNNENIIEVSGLSHSYDDLRAVDNISFRVKKGEIFSFLGPNGAGKSTAINVLITLLPLQKGEVFIAGHNLSSSPKYVRDSIGIVFQEITLDRDMTVRETLEFHGNLYSMGRDEIGSRIEELLGLVELSDKKDILTKNLSGGMKRRLEIARGLMTRPKVLFLDEPTIGLDPQTRRKTWDYLRMVNDEGTTIFLTTHYMDEADILSDWISIIDHGRIIASGTPEDLKNSLGEDIICLETADTELAKTAIINYDGIKSITESGEGLVIMTDRDGAQILPEIISGLNRDEITISSVNLKKPSMDDVFMHYTGKELRD